MKYATDSPGTIPRPVVVVVIVVVVVMVGAVIVED